MLVGIDTIIFLFPYNSSAGLATANHMEGTMFFRLTFASDSAMLCIEGNRRCKEGFFWWDLPNVSMMIHSFI